MNQSLEFAPRRDEANIERRLAEIEQILRRTKSHQEYSELWREFVELHKQRSPETVSRMERAKGLL